VWKLKTFFKLARVSSVGFFVQILQPAAFPLALSRLLQGLSELVILKDLKNLIYHLFLLLEIYNYVLCTLSNHCKSCSYVHWTRHQECFFFVCNIGMQWRSFCTHLTSCLSCRDDTSEVEVVDVNPGTVVSGTVAHVNDNVIIMDISTARGSIKGYLNFPHLSDNLGKNNLCSLDCAALDTSFSFRPPSIRWDTSIHCSIPLLLPLRSLIVSRFDIIRSFIHLRVEELIGHFCLERRSCWPAEGCHESWRANWPASCLGYVTLVFWDLYLILWNLSLFWLLHRYLVGMSWSQI